MNEKNKYPSNLIPVKKMIKIPVYSSVRLENGKLVGDFEGYSETPAELLQDEKRKEH